MDAVYNVSGDANAPGWARVPFYTASMGASITVEVELQKRGWKRFDRKDVRLVRCA
jgi:hypothetical protein